MPVIRNAHYERNFALFDKTGLDYDDRLSWAAKGVLSYVLAKPANWEVNVKDLVNRSIDGKTLVYNALKELRHFGYITYCEEKTATGQIQEWCYYVYATPEQNPQREDPDTLPLSKKHQGIDKRKAYPGGKRTKKPHSENLNVLENGGSSAGPHSEILNIENLNTKKNKNQGRKKNKKEGREISHIWQDVLAHLEKRINRPSFNTWLRPTSLISITDQHVVIGVPEEVFVYWLEAYYTQPLQKTIKEITGKQMSVEYRVDLPN